MPVQTELPAKLIQKENSEGIVFKLAKGLIDSPVGGIIFGCNLQSNITQYMSLCAQADPEAKKIVEKIAKETMPFNYSKPEGLDERAFAVDTAISSALASRSIVERDGHAVATQRSAGSLKR